MRSPCILPGVTQEHPFSRESVCRPLPGRFEGQHTGRDDRDIIQFGSQKRFGWAGQAIAVEAIVL
jgi:hypothetical protein